MTLELEIKKMKAKIGLLLAEIDSNNNIIVSNFIVNNEKQEQKPAREMPL